MLDRGADRFSVFQDLALEVDGGGDFGTGEPARSRSHQGGPTSPRSVVPAPFLSAGVADETPRVTCTNDSARPASLFSGGVFFACAGKPCQLRHANINGLKGSPCSVSGTSPPGRLLHGAARATQEPPERRRPTVLTAVVVSWASRTSAPASRPSCVAATVNVWGPTMGLTRR